MQLSREFYEKLVAIGHSFLIGFGNDQVHSMNDSFLSVDAGEGYTKYTSSRDSLGIDRYETVGNIGNNLPSHLRYDAVRVAKRLTEQDREDIIHDAILSLMYGKSGKSFAKWVAENPQGNPYSIYFRSLRQRALDALGKASFNREYPLESAKNMSTCSELGEGILDALEGDIELGKIVALTAIGKTQKEIGKTLGIRDRTVRRRMVTLTAKLQNYYRQ